jgi:hypothetical protein
MIWLLFHDVQEGCETDSQRGQHSKPDLTAAAHSLGYSCDPHENRVVRTKHRAARLEAEKLRMFL